MTPTLAVVLLLFAIILLFLWTKLVQMRRVEFIREFSLPPGLYDKLREKHQDLSLKDCQLVGHALRQFFLAYLKSGKQYISMPSQVVDDLWHEFILYTRNYAQFCRRAFGGFLHHKNGVDAEVEVATNRSTHRAERSAWCRRGAAGWRVPQSPGG